MGELGNQLFQIAATIGYSRKNGFEAKFPSWDCKISGSNYGEIFKGPIDQTLKDTDYDGPVQIFSYQDLKFVNIPKIDTHLDLAGYFQSENYFKHCEEEIKDIFKPSLSVQEILLSKYPEIMGDNDFVAVHVRTGKRSQNDYDVHSYCTSDFLNKAFELYDTSRTFVVFSDRMEIAKEILPPERNYIFIEGEKNYIDLFLLNNFKDYILSSSTFGWWGAWLSKYSNPKVTMMANWFDPNKAKSSLNDNDIMPERWSKI